MFRNGIIQLMSQTLDPLTEKESQFLNFDFRVTQLYILKFRRRK